jgi:hypothetical protein
MLNRLLFQSWPRSALLAIASLLLGLSAQAADYKFTNIADTSGPFIVFEYRVSLNNAGTVVFPATLDTGLRGVFTGNGGPTTTSVDSGGPFSNFLGATINDSGAIAFNGWLDNARRGIYSIEGGGGSPTTIADSSGPFDSFGQFPAIDGDGNVAYHGVLDTGGSGIYTSGSPTPVVDTTGAFELLDAPTRLANATGTMVFWGRFANGGTSAVLTATAGGGSPTAIADTSGDFSSLTSTRLSIADSGEVAFIAGLDAGGQGVFTSSGGTTPLAHTSGPFDLMVATSINSDGVVAFGARLDGGTGFGIFTGPDPLLDSVIQPGDSLFGSTVTTAALGDINNNGVIAFTYILENGVKGIAVAQIPEPASAALLGVAGLALSDFRRDQRRQKGARL